MYDASAIKSASLIFSLIPYSFMELLEPELLDPLDTDDFLLFELFEDFLERFSSLSWI